MDSDGPCTSYLPPQTRCCTKPEARLRLQPLCIPSKIPSIKLETSPGDGSVEQCLFKDVMDRAGMKFIKEVKPHAS